MVDRIPVTDGLLDRVLERLGLTGPPAIDRTGLDDLYRTWCHGVPFDNTVRATRRGRPTKEVQAMAGLGNGSGNGHEHVVRYFGTCCVSQIQAHCLPVHDD